MTESKEDTIKKVYENKVTGYGSVRDTYLQANKINPGIRYIDVKEYLDKQQHRQTQFQYKNFNSFVSPHPLFEIETDLIDLTSKAGEMLDLDIVEYGLIILLSMLGVCQLKQKKSPLML